MDYKQEVFNAWCAHMQSNLKKYSWSLNLLSQKISRVEYASYLLQTYHHAYHNPQLQALATSYFEQRDRDLVKGFLRHATSEIGHDKMALSDLERLGYDSTSLSKLKPLSETTALTAYGFYITQFRSATAYLGYLYHLEFMPTTMGADFLKGLTAAGIDDTAQTFLHEHATVDVGHNKLMHGYFDKLILSPSDRDIVIDAAITTCDLHFNMVQSACSKESLEILNRHQLEEVL